MKKTKIERLNSQTRDIVRKMTREEFIRYGLESTPKNSCAFILENDMKLIEFHYDMDADVDSAYFENGLYELELFLKYGETPSNEHFYFVIHCIDTVGANDQLKFLPLVKDRYVKTIDDLPDEITVVFTVEAKDNVKSIVHPLWNIGFDLID